jgi:Cysteine rich repeat
MKKSWRLAAAVLLSSAAWLAAPSFAFEGHGDGACKADVEKFCSDVTGGHHAVGECLHEHQSDLSTECQAKLEKFGEHKQRFMACHDDVKKLCGDVDRDQIKDCLNEHESELSDGCRAARKPQS